MIERYQIKKIENEEVLYLYLNYSHEFGDFLKNTNISNTKERIKNIANMKIKFKGTKVLFIVGGIGLAAIFLPPFDIQEIQVLQNQYITSSNVEQTVNVDSTVDERLEKKKVAFKQKKKLR